MRALLLSVALLAPVSAIFFGGGGGGCGCEPAPQPACQPSCGCGGGGGGYSAPAAYPQPVAAPCRPRYVIVRPVESGASYSGGAIGGGAIGGGYASAPVGAGPVDAPQYSAPQFSAPQYSAPVAAPAAVQTPVASYATGAAAFASKTVNAEGKCSNKELRKVLQREMVAGDANESKRRVYKAANEQFSSADSNKTIDVICAPALISYRVSTDFFCEFTKEDITCFVFQQA